MTGSRNMTKAKRTKRIGPIGIKCKKLANQRRKDCIDFETKINKMTRKQATRLKCPKVNKKANYLW